MILALPWVLLVIVAAIAFGLQTAVAGVVLFCVIAFFIIRVAGEDHETTIL